MARIVPANESLLGPLLESGAIGRFGQVLDEIIRQRREDEANQGTNVENLITELTDPKLSEDEQANLVQRKVQLLPDKQFKRRYGITKDEFLAGLEPPTGSAEATAREAGLPPQSPQQGPMGERVARRGVAPEQRMREAVAATQEVAVDTGRTRLEMAKSEFNRMTNEATARLRSGPDAPRKDNGQIMTANEARQFLRGAPDDPATQAVVDQVTFPGPLATMVNEVASVVQQLPDGQWSTPESANAYAKKFVAYMQMFHPQAMAQLQEAEGALRLKLLKEQIAALQLETDRTKNPVMEINAAAAMARRKEITDATNDALSFFVGEQQSLKGMKIDDKGVVIPGTMFFGMISTEGDPTTTRATQSPLHASDFFMLVNPMNPIAQQAYIDAGLPPPSPSEAMSEADVERALGAIEKKLGHKIESMRVVDTDEAMGFREVPRTELVARALAARSAIIPNYMENITGDTAEMGLAVSNEERIRQAMATLNEAMGGQPAPTPGTRPIDLPAQDPMQDAFGAFMIDYLNRQSATRQAYVDQLKALQEQLATVPTEPEEEILPDEGDE